MKKITKELIEKHDRLERQIGLVDVSGRYDFNGFKRYENVIKHIKGEIPELSEADKEMIEEDQRVLKELVELQVRIARSMN